MNDESAVELLIERLNSVRDSLRGSIPEWGELHLPMSKTFIDKLCSEFNPLHLAKFSGLSRDKEKCKTLCKALHQKYEDTYAKAGPNPLIPVLLNRDVLYDLLHIIGVYRVEYLGDKDEDTKEN